MKKQLQELLIKTDLTTDLSYLGLIKVTGADAQQFLQGQFTNDITKVNSEQHQLSALCSHKGRIIVSFRIFQHEAAFYLLLPKESLASVIKRLQMYVLRSAVKIEDASGNLTRIGISGINSEQILTDCLFAPPAEIDSNITKDGITILKIAGTIPRYIILGDKIPIECLTKLAKLEDSQTWQLLDILAGLPTVGLATTEEFVPQMINYHNINGVSFKKGCYTGQEIIARLHYLGEVKRQLYIAKIDSNKTPQSGNNLQANEEKVGKIVNVAPHPEGGFLILASLIIKHVETNDIHWENSKLQFMEKSL
ncbi:MAG TPA: folate-binding protein [Thioploca sp.]|nr:folate-binding protein [Thioploca sp.]